MDHQSVMDIVEIAINGVVTLSAAFAGAWYAFKLTDREKARDQSRDRVAAINKAQFVLIQQLNLLKQIQSQTIDPVRDHGLRFVAMRPLLPQGESTPRLNFESLSFLLETDDRDLPFSLLLEQQRFETAIQAFNERSRLHRESIQPRLVAGGIAEGGSYTNDVVVAAIGRELALTVQRLTEDSVRSIDLTIDSTVKLINAFHAAMKKRFPKHKIIRAELAEPSNKPLQPTSAYTPSTGGISSARG